MKIKVFRRITQILTILLIVTIPILNRKGITILMGSLYSLAIDGVWMTDPLSGFQVILSTLSADSVLLISMTIPILLALIFGRVFCSWMCPQNTLSELFDYVSNRFSVRRLIDLSPWAAPRYIIMAAFLLLTLILGFPVANLISAPGIISVQISKYVYEGTVGLEMGLIGVIVLSEIFLVRRVWCNYICPVGSFLGLFRFNKTMKVLYKEDAEHVCGKCLECVKACQLGLNPMEGRIYPLCYNCGDCIAACERIKDRGKPLLFKF
ncbi:MAG: 4Fe-4S binding protein [Thermodesulfovibrionales bacterium]|jgi:ferredoxin-type protein NapH|nr:4Fe-4S binding protein [Thermodesulfovibrionales bacterium]RJR13253.1 MAG: 4Fe-4S binding protein [Candidatus Parcubacteria bacterium]